MFDMKSLMSLPNVEFLYLKIIANSLLKIFKVPLNEVMEDGRFYSLLQMLPYHYDKWWLVEMKILFHHFRDIITAVMIVCFLREHKLLGFYVSRLFLASFLFSLWQFLLFLQAFFLYVWFNPLTTRGNWWPKHFERL